MLTNEQIDQIKTFIGDQTGYEPRPLGTHSCGLPHQGQVGFTLGYIQDPNSYADYYDGFIVYELAVVRAHLKDPYNYREWVVHNVNYYSDKDELINMLPKKPAPKPSAWD